MRMARGSCHLAIAVEMRQEGFGQFKPSKRRPTIVELHRLPVDLQSQAATDREFVLPGLAAHP